MAAPVIQVENLTKSFGDRLLFGDLTFGISEGEKIGLVARNGTGKTTLLKILAGEDTPDSGKIIPRNGLRIGYLEQLPQFPEGVTVMEACLSSSGPVVDAVKAYHHALDSGNETAISEAMHNMDATEAWDYEQRLTQMLSQVNITDTSAIIDTLSGGQRKRVALAAALLENPDLLILDEPTNHLDIAATEWLDDYLSRSRLTVFMVTHDRYFLDRVCNRIFEIDGAELFAYDGNYDYYLRRRAERHQAAATELDRVKNTLRKEQDWMSRQPQARAGKAKFRIDAYYSLVERSRGGAKEKDVNLDVKSSRIGSKIFEARDISKKFGDKIILDGFTYDFAKGEKVGIVGGNGVGKSTFVKMLMGILPQDSGEWNVGETVRFGYYSQEGLELNPEKKVIDAVTELADDIVVNGNVHFTPMQFLKRFLFEPSDQQKYIGGLSGGERCRLQLAVVMMRSPNFLILDEPTNDLDIMTLTVLEDYLREFSGCVIVISHDRYFLDSITDHLFVMEGEGTVKDFPGNYSEYNEWKKAQDKKAEKNSVPSADKAPKKEKTQKKERKSYAEQKEFERLEKEIEELSSEKQELEEQFNTGGDSEIILKAAERYEEVKRLLDEKELRWLELDEKD
ncbi:MAG: ABC-F family ATP-binding cassette domain-containing protein [Paramuribaculum sp.]|nr:ABC-F family ATP-binding cassette domain-containing protein [Paramuribaculum sp.]